MTPAARLEHPRDFGERALGLRHVVEHQHQRRRIEPRIVDRQRFELAAAQIDVVESLQPLPRRLQHRRRGVDRDDPRDERRERGADLAGAAAEIADDPVGVGQRRERRQVKRDRRTARRAGDPTGPADEEKNSWDLVRRAASAACEPPLILRRGRRRPDLLAHERATGARRPVAGQSEVARRVIV